MVTVLYKFSNVHDSTTYVATVVIRSGRIWRGLAAVQELQQNSLLGCRDADGVCDFQTWRDFRVSYDPIQHTLSDPDDEDDDDDDAAPVEPTSPRISQHDMDAPEISTLREEEEESPSPETGFSKFRVNMRGPSWGQPGAAANGPPLGPQLSVRKGLSPPDSDDEDEEDQLIDDDEIGIVTETGRVPPASEPPSMVAVENPTPPKRVGVVKVQGPRRPPTGRRGRPGREPPDAAAMMSTFEVAKADQPAPAPPQIIPPPPVTVQNPPPRHDATAVAGPSTTSEWSTSTLPKPLRKKPGPKKGTTLGPRGPKKNSLK